MSQLDSKKLRQKYLEFDAENNALKNRCFFDYIQKIVDRYAIRFKSSNKLNLAKTLGNIGFDPDETQTVTNWYNRKNCPMNENQRRDLRLAISLKAHLYELEIPDDESLSYTSVYDSFEKVLDNLFQDPLYVFRYSDFCVLLAFKLQDYRNGTPQEIFAQIYNTYTTLLQRNLLSEIPVEEKKASSDQRKLVDVTHKAYRNFIRITELGDSTDLEWNETESITAFQFLNRYYTDFNRCRVTPFLVLSLILSECLPDHNITNYSIYKRTLSNWAEENITAIDELLKTDFNISDLDIPNEFANTLTKFVDAIRYKSTLERASLILFAAMFLDRQSISEIVGHEQNRQELLRFFNQSILEPCGYAPLDYEHPRNKEEFAVLAAMIDADFSSGEHPLGDYICECFFEELTMPKLIDTITLTMF